MERSIANACVVVMRVVLVGVAMSCFATTAHAEDASVASTTVTLEEYATYVDWRDGREDPRLASQNDDTKLRRIAASLGISANKMQAIVRKVEPLVSTLASDNERAIRKALQATPVRERMLDVSVDVEQAHVIAALKWRCGDARDLNSEAAFVAWSVADASPPVKTVALWCVNDDNQKLFSAKIGREAFTRIRRDDVPRFSSTRYIRLFEDIRRG